MTPPHPGTDATEAAGTQSGQPVLPALLRAATQAQHQQAERAGVMGALLRGRLPLERYAALLRDLRLVYAALESRPLPIAPLGRRQALDADLAVLHEAGAARAPAGSGQRASPAARELAARVAAADAPALAAHTYVRYLGDLHGGQVLAPLVRRQYALPPGRGTAFYEFGGEAELARLRAALRSALSALPFGEAARAAAVAEARWAFAMHVRLFEELAAPAGAADAAVQPADERRPGSR